MTSRRILVIDDNVHAADALAIILRTWGHDVRVAYDGPDGLDRGAGYSPQVVFLDIEMPSMDGFEVAERLRDDPTFAGGFLVALSGHDIRDLPRTRDTSLFDHWLRKPFDFDVLETLIARSVPDATPSSLLHPG